VGFENSFLSSVIVAQLQKTFFNKYDLPRPIGRGKRQ